MAKDKEKKDPFKLVLGSHRVSYVTLKEPKAFEDDKTPKYSVTFLIQKDSPDVARIKKVLNEMYKANKESKFKGLPITSKKIWNPLRDGDEYADEKEAEGVNADAYRGCYYLKATSISQPKAFDSDKQDILDLDEVYSGCYCRGVIVGNAYHNTDYKTRGFSFYLNSVMKMKEGEQLGGVSASPDEYDDDYDDEDDDML